MAKNKNKKKTAVATTTATPAPEAKAEGANATATPATETKTEAKATAKKSVEKLQANHPALRLKREIGALAKIKTVDNGDGYWIGNIRVLKVGKTLPQDTLLFPRPNVKDLVKAGSLGGSITVKNVAQIQVTDANFQQLLGLVKASIKEATAYDTAKAEKKAKAAAAKKADAKAKPTKEAEVKQGPTPTQQPKAVAA